MGDNTSALAGILTPTGVAPLYDDALVDALQPLWVALTGIPGTMFRPRWQPDDVPNQPEQNETWAALGIATTRTDTFAYTEHVPEGDGYNYVMRTEEIDVLTSFYGPSAKACAEQLRDGFTVEQNREPLDAMKMALVNVRDSIMIPALLHGKWQRRVDVTVTLRRVIERRYGILTVLGLPDAVGPDAGPVMGLNNEQYITPLVFQS